MSSSLQIQKRIRKPSLESIKCRRDFAEQNLMKLQRMYDDAVQEQKKAIMYREILTSKIGAFIASKNNVLVTIDDLLMIIVFPNGKMKVTSGGWMDYDTHAAMNIALHEVGMKIVFQGKVEEGKWQLIDDKKKRISFHDGLIVKTNENNASTFPRGKVSLIFESDFRV